MTQGKRSDSWNNGNDAGRKGKSASRKRTVAVGLATSSKTVNALFNKEIQSHTDSEKMAASRVDSSRRLCVRYKYYFLVAVLILSLQLFISASFLGINQTEDPTNDAIPVNERRIHSNNEKLPRHRHHLVNNNNNNNNNNNFGDVNINNNNKRVDNNNADGKKEKNRVPAMGISLPVKKVTLPPRTPTTADSQDYVPKCNLTIKDTLTAIGRASSVQCKQELADLGCRLQEGTVYKGRLPSYCPNVGNDGGVYYGCYRDKTSSRDLEGGMQEFSDNSVQKCIDHCRRSGQKFAGLQYTKECWCGQQYGRHSKRLEEAHCSTQCPGNSSETCGAFLTNKIYGTGAKEIVRQPAPLNHPVLNDTVQRVKIVFVLTVNGRAARQVMRLIRVIYSPDHYYFIHVDKRQEFLYRELLPLQERFPNIMVTSKRFSTIWGGASLLQAHLSFLDQLFTDRPQWAWDYYINLSESDYPIKTVTVLTEYLTAYNGLNFLKSHGGHTPRFIKKQGLDKTFYECDNHLWRVGIRPLPGGIVMDGGSDWMGLHRAFAKYVVTSQDELVTGLKEMYHYALLPVESFFHVVLQNSVFCSQSIDNNLHLTNWRRKQGCQCQYKHIVDWCGCSPNDLKMHDLQKLVNLETKPLFFARKFEAFVDQEIINSLDITMFGYIHQNIPGLSNYWQNVYHHLDRTTRVKDAALTIYNSILRRYTNQLRNKFEDKSCNLTAVKVQEVNTFSQLDKFQGLLIQGTTRIDSSGNDMVLEIHSVPKHYYQMMDQLAAKGRLHSLEVGTDFDLKERIFRNYGNLIGPYDDLSLRHEWGSGISFTVSIAWVDPTNIIAASYDVEIPQSPHPHIGNQKPHVSRPLRPGIWSAKIMVNYQLVAETQFLVTPLTFSSNKPATETDVLRFHQGPIGSYTSLDFSEFLPNLGLKDSPKLRLESEMNGRKTGKDLEDWVDSLSMLFWLPNQACVLHGSGACSHLPNCNSTNWSSRSLDMKSDIRYVGVKFPLIKR